MNLLPLEIILGLQVAAALVIMLALVADKADKADKVRDPRRLTNRRFDDRQS